MTLVAHSFHWLPSADNSVGGDYPNGDKPPDAVDLAWDASALAALVTGFNNLETGTPTSVNVRAALTGTNAASATIAFSNYTGDEPVSEGWASPGAGNNLTHDGVATGSGTFQLRATYSGDSVDSATIVWQYITTALVRSLYWYADFETGAIQNSAQSHDGCYIKCLPHPQTDYGVDASGTSGGYTTTATDVRVVASEVVGAETVTPRKGSYFCRSILYYDKQYEVINGGTYPNATLNKPRTEIAPKYWGSVPWSFDWDQEVWIGFSIYLPLNHEHETGIKDHRGEVIVFSIIPKPSSSHLVLSYYVPSGGTTAQWFLLTNTNATSILEGAAGETVLNDNLGSVVPDLGKWTDFVIRYRANPFTTSTNASTITGGKNVVYPGNTGVLQVWKGEGAVDGSGNRTMSLKKSIVNAPVGLVPQVAYPFLYVSWKAYKYGWHTNPTDVAGPIWNGFDSLRIGRTILDGSGFADVSPSGLAAP